MTIEIPFETDWIPFLLIIAGMVTSRIGDGPNLWMFLSAFLFIAGGVSFFWMLI